MQRKGLSVRPGITDWALIEYVDEDVILGAYMQPNKVKEAKISNQDRQVMNIKLDY